MDALLNVLKGLGPVKLAIMALVTVVLLGVFAIISFKLSAPTLVPLYSGLAPADGSKIVQELEARKIPYKIVGDGTEVLVPAEQVPQLRMNLAAAGIPSSGSIVGYEIFDKADALGTSNFLYNINNKRALEGELSRTIMSFDTIDNARVHLVIPKRVLFEQEAQEPRASIILKIKGKQNLSRSQIQAISHLVVTAVPGLKLENITIVDTTGRPLKLGVKDELSLSGGSGEAQDYQVMIEQRLKQSVESLVAQTIGEGKIKAHVTADINFDRVVTNSETFDPDSQVARSVQTIEENENANNKEGAGNVSVANNLPNQENGGSQGAQSSSNNQKVDETTNFEISKTVKNQISESGTIKRLSIAVLVDGTYSADPKTGKQMYAARSEDELSKIRALASSAVGFKKERGDTIEVINMPFERQIEEVKDDKLAWLKDDFQNLMQTLIIGVVVILAILLIIRPMVNKAFEASATAEAEEARLLGTQEVTNFVDIVTEDLPLDDDMMDINNTDQASARVKTMTIKSVNEAIQKHPDEALSVMRTWLYGNNN
ncbi:MAG: flagellar M-ring protein FliF [Alphaproteobacteria bacterium]|nr:flagellar M-ring protein FliF [Alphaproteobacteria bacterium]